MKIKYLIMDVDGTLTDGCIYMGAEGELMKAFHAQDGYAIAQLLPKYGITPVIITGRSSKILERRCGELGITRLYQGVQDKLSLLKTLDAASEEMAYIGDDLNDLECIEYCGVTGCPGDAVAGIRAAVDFVCERKGGRGAVREFIDWILQNQ